MNNVKVLSDGPDVTLKVPSNPTVLPFYRAELRVLIEGDSRPIRLIGHGSDEETAIRDAYLILQTIRNGDSLQ